MSKQGMGSQEPKENEIEEQNLETSEEPVLSKAELGKITESADKARNKEKDNPAIETEARAQIEVVMARVEAQGLPETPGGATNQKEYHRRRASLVGLNESASESDVLTAEENIRITELEKKLKELDTWHDNPKAAEIRRLDIMPELNSLKRGQYDRMDRNSKIAKEKKAADALEARRQYIAENFSTMSPEEKSKLKHQEIEDYWTPERRAEETAKNAQKTAERDRLWMEGEPQRQAEKAEKERLKNRGLFERTRDGVRKFFGGK